MNNQREKLVNDLKKLKTRGYQLNQNEPDMGMIHAMLDYIGDTDHVLRDELIYTTFSKFIYEKKVTFEMNQLLEILEIVLDDQHLFYQVGANGDDSVFTRTFSVLIVDFLLYHHNQNPYLPIERFTYLKDRLLKYYLAERDWRGYDKEKGWAHGAAHGADALLSLAECQESDIEVRREILKALQCVLQNGNYFLCHEEDERMALVIISLIKKDLYPISMLGAWIEGLADSIPQEYSPEQYKSRINTKNFIRCLYFSLKDQPNTKAFTDLLFKTEAKVNMFK